MSTSEQALLSLLFEEGRELENLKFFPGDECSSADELFDAAVVALRLDLDGKGVERIPASEKSSAAIGDLIQSL